MDTLPTLQGTEKQVEWATRIRLEMLDDLDRYLLAPGREKTDLKGAEKYGITKEALLRHDEVLKVAAFTTREIMLAHTDAGWWINNRGFVLANMVRYATDLATLQALKEQDRARIAQTREDNRKRRAEEQAEEEARLTRMEEARIQTADRAARIRASLATFHVKTVVKDDDDSFTVTSENGRIAKGLIDGGTWFIYEIDGEDGLSTFDADLRAIADTARARLERTAR